MASFMKLDKRANRSLFLAAILGRQSDAVRPTVAE